MRTRVGVGVVVWILTMASQRGSSAQQQGQSCPPGSTSPECIGQWIGPYDLEVSCGVSSGCGSCSAFFFPSQVPYDEIGHAALIPVGVHAGKVLLWTRCDDSTGRPNPPPPTIAGYKTYIWDPNDPNPQGAPLPSVDIVSVLGIDKGPFCGAHVWILDADRNPKLFAIGGSHYTGTSYCDVSAFWNQSFYCGHNKCYWFDPLDPSGGAWSDLPTDLTTGNATPVPNWYPSITTYLEPSGTKFSPIILGGSASQGTGCGFTTSGYPWQYTDWWTLPSSYTTSNWITHGGTIKWNLYPRVFPLEGGDILSVGHEVSCELPLPGATTPYGGNPVHQVTASTMVHSYGPDPNPASPAAPTVGGWHYSHAVILHTLKNKTAWNTTSPLTNYDLNRIIVTGGTPEGLDDNFTTPYQLIAPLSHTRELSNGQWSAKSPSIRPRVFANLVPLPDGTLLYVGGQDNLTPVPTSYYEQVERFDPQGPPPATGMWKDMATRPIVGSDPAAGGPFAVPRAYHSVALLLKDGTVAVMGGQPQGTIPYVGPGLPDQADTVEIYQPPYHFLTPRPRITAQPPDMCYVTASNPYNPASPYLVTVNDAGAVSYACLLGVGSMTHHFDYGARYLELMVRPVSGSGTSIEVLPPASPTMAPEGYYMLFVVELRPQGQGLVAVPSKGRFIKLTF